MTHAATLHSTIVLVGGDIRNDQLCRLRRSVPNLDVEWIATRASDPGPSRYQFKVVRPETVLVVILDGLVRHEHSRHLLQLCRRHSKRYVRLYRSLNAERIVGALAS